MILIIYFSINIKSSGYYNFSLKNRHSSFVVNNSNACIPNSELPFLFNLGDHVATKDFRNKATPPPIPLLPVIPLYR
jgi:hypothetical protein